jgi:hypothetical protein
MKDLEKIADELVEKFVPYSDTLNSGQEGEIINATQCAIESVNYTIETLNEIIKKEFIDDIALNNAIAEQLKLKKILEGRL